MKTQIVQSNRHVKLPEDVFTECPECETTQLLKFEGQVFCLKCDWDSIELHAECEIFDHCRRFKEARGLDTSGDKAPEAIEILMVPVFNGDPGDLPAIVP